MATLQLGVRSIVSTQRLAGALTSEQLQSILQVIRLAYQPENSFVVGCSRGSASLVLRRLVQSDLVFFLSFLPRLLRPLDGRTMLNGWQLMAELLLQWHGYVLPLLQRRRG